MSACVCVSVTVSSCAGLYILMSICAYGGSAHIEMLLVFLHGTDVRGKNNNIKTAVRVREATFALLPENSSESTSR